MKSKVVGDVMKKRVIFICIGILICIGASSLVFDILKLNGISGSIISGLICGLVLNLLYRYEKSN